MDEFISLHGVYAAAVTPLKVDHSPDLEALPVLLEFLAHRGCHGVLLLGTTGEGPAFSPTERASIFNAAANWRKSQPGFRLLAGTGTPSLQETIEINQAALGFGLDGVVTLPPYYYRSVSDDGLFAWFSQVMRQSVPAGKAFYGYHFPKISGVPLSPDLLERLLAAFPEQFAGIKDSSGEADFARLLGGRFGDTLHIMTGNDRLFTHALQNQAAGCITAMANIYSPFLRTAWDAFQSGTPNADAQEALSQRREVLDRFPPAPALLKAMLADLHGLPLWPVRPALLPLDPSTRALALAAFKALDS